MNARKDQNNISTLIAALNTDGVTTINIQVNSSRNALKVSNDTTGSDYGTINAQRDQNRVPILIAVSRTDGVTPIEVYADSNGNLLTTTS